MSVTRWLASLGLMTALGMLVVAQQTAIRLQAYAVGRHDARLQRLRNDAVWTTAQVAGLQSPLRLAAVMHHDARAKFVAWSELPAVPRGARLAHAYEPSSEVLR